MDVGDGKGELDGKIGRIGARLGICGAILLSLNNAVSPFGYVLFLSSSLSLMYWAKRNRCSHQFEMQLVFTAVNALGGYNWIIKPMFL